MSDVLDLAEYLADYLTESGDHLLALDEHLLEAERLAEQGQAADEALINGLFRAIHTLKGMAGMMGFAATTALAHEVEQHFDEIRRGVRQLHPADFPALFAAMDALKRLNGRIGEVGSEAGLDTHAALAGLARLGQAPAPVPAPAEPAASKVCGLMARLDPHDAMQVLVAAAKGLNVYEIEIHPEAECAGGAAAWLEGVALVGQILGAWDGTARPLDAAAPGAPATLQVLILSEAAPEQVREYVGVPAERFKLAVLPWQQPAAPVVTVTTAAAAPAEAGERATAIRVEAARLDRLMELVGELVIHHGRVTRLGLDITTTLEEPGPLDQQRARLEDLAADLDAALQTVARVNDELQEGTMRLRMVPVRTLFNRFPRIVRDLARELGKSARLEVEGGDTELDKTVIEQIGDPLVHLIRNALDHGLEPPEARQAAGKPAQGVVTLAAAQRGHHILITIRDDGRGIDRARVLAKARESGLVGEGDQPADHEVLGLIFRPGFSTAAAITNLSGRGVGMDVVHQNVQRLGGQIHVASEPGAGTTFTIKLPLTLAIAQALLVGSGDQTFAIPLAVVEETLRLAPGDIKAVRGADVIQVRGEVVPLFRLRQLFGQPPVAGGERLPAVILGDGTHRMALVVDTLVGQQDVVVKSLGDFLGAVPGVGGATILGDGRVALILDAQSLLLRQPG